VETVGNAERWWRRFSTVSTAWVPQLADEVTGDFSVA
jgi:hypothetical protein